MVQSLNYYTGVIFRGFTHGIGFPVLSGGRYDTLTAGFGSNCPATGFSLGLSMIMTALERQKVWDEKPVTDSLVCYRREGRKTAFSICEELRKQGLAIEADITGAGVETVQEYARKKGIGGVINVLDDNSIEVHNIYTGEVQKTTIQELLNR
jgi:ATP phosphoribosyltransferase regulatory subunit